MLSEQEREGLYELGVLRSFPRGAVLMFQDEPDERVMMLTSGRVKVGRVDHDGHELMLSIRDASAHPRRARPLKAIDYDPGADTLEIVTDGCITGDGTLRYFIAAPRRITVAESAGAGAILVEDAGGIRTLIRLFNLPRPLDRDEPPAQVAQMTSRNGDRERSW